MADSSQRPLQVLLVADPGLASRRASAISERFEKHLQSAYGPDTTLQLHTDMLRLEPNHELALGAVEQLTEKYSGVDVILLLTEIPRHTRGKPLVAEALTKRKIAIVSCPTLGAWNTKRRILTVLTRCVDALVTRSKTTDQNETIRWGRWATDHAGDSSDSGERLTLHAHTSTGAPRLVLGMTLANDPWRTAPKLSSALAAASATGAFGIFYNSIWQMSGYLPTWRLLAIGAGAILVMMTWLIISHRLWDKPVDEGLGTVVLFYNLSTVLTLLLCVLALYVLLAALILLGGLLVIDPSFMSKQIGSQATFSNYLDIAWLSAAMGVVAGGLGASFDSDIDIRRITHGQRLRQRVYTQQESNTGDDVDDPDSSSAN